MSVLEAAAVGTPLIITTDCGLSADLRAGDAAELAEPSVDAFCEAMRKLAVDPQRRAQLGANARQLHRRLWSSERLAESLAAHYAEATNAR